MANLTTRLYDGMKSVLSGLGGSVDSNASASWFTRTVTQAEIDASFRTSWLSKKVHTIPPTDMVRPWRKWLASPEQITAIEAEERRLGLRQKVRKALLWSRLYGGAAIILGVDGDDPAEPLEVDRIRQGGLSYIHVLTRYELHVQGMEMDPGSRFYGEPKAYTVNGGASTTTIHPSRVVRFVNGELPDTIAFGEQGWGDPLLMSIRDALIHADGAQGHFAALPAKALTSTLTIPGLLGIASTKAGEQQIIEKTRIAQAFRSMFHLNIVSGPSRQGELGEEWKDNQVSFAAIPEMGTWFVQMVSGAADVPMTRLAGTSPGGMNATGDSDTANYWTMLDAGRELDLRPRMEMIDEALIRSATGERDPDIWFEWMPFEVDTETTRAENASKRATAIKTLRESEAVPSEVLEKLAKGQIIDSGEYPGAEEAYAEYDAAGEVQPIEADNDNTVLAAAAEGLVAGGTARSMAAQDAAVMLADGVPMPLHVSRPLLNGDELAAWARDNGLNPINPAKMHVTVAYSKQPLDWMKLGGDDWSENPGVTVVGGPRMLERFGPERKVIVLAFSSSRLGYRHEEILRAGASWDWPEYQPHVTIDYDAPDDIDIETIKPFVGELRFGVERFEKTDTEWGSKDD